MKSSLASPLLQFIFSLLGFIYISCCQAADKKLSSLAELTTLEQAWVKQHPQIQVGGSPDWTPFNFVNAKGQYSGIASDYLNLIALKTGLDFEVSINQWHHSLEKIRNKKIDLLTAVYHTEERRQYLIYSTPYFEVLDYFFIRDDLDVHTLADLNGKRVAIPKSYAHITLLKKHFPAIKIIPVDSFGLAIDAVLENRADMLYDTYGALIYTLEKEGINTIIPFKSSRNKVGNNPIHFVTRKDAPELAEIIQKGLNAITPKEKRAIYNKWLGNIPKADNQALSLSTQELEWISSHPVIRYGAEKDWAPYDFINEHGSHTGLTKDYLQLISQSSGLKFVAIIDDWDKLLQQLSLQKIDLLPAIYFSESRNKYLNFTQPYLSILDYFFIHEAVEATNINDLDGKTIAIPMGYAHIETIQQRYPQLKILQTDSLMTAIQSLIERKADILLESYAVINHQLKTLGVSTIHPLEALKATSRMKLHMATRKDQAILTNIMDKALAAIPESEKNRINNRWLGYQAKESAVRIKLSQEEKKWLSDHPQIRFTGDPNWLPYEAFNKQGQYQGIVAEYLKLIEQKLAIKVDIIPAHSWSEAVSKVKQGQIDILSETNDSDLKSHLHFTQPYLSSPVVIIMKDEEQYVDNIDQIKLRKIAVIKEYGYVPKIIKRYPDIKFHSVDTIQQGLTEVSTGKIDALIATLAQASYHIPMLGINNIRIVGKTEFTTQLAFGMRTEFKPLVGLFNRALNTISPNEKKRIHNIWGKPRYAAKIDYLLISKIAALFIFTLLIFIYWNRRLAKEIALRKDIEAQTQTLIDNIPLQIIVTTFEGHILTANPKVLSDYKIHKEDISHFNVAEFYHHPEEREAIIQELKEQGKVEQKIVQFNQPDGSLRSMMISIMPINYHKQTSLLTIAIDMTERLEMEATIKTAKESAEAANRAKSDFLANMSHEIRTPMNAIIGFTELLSEQITEPRHKSFVKTIQSAGNNLLTLINDILDLSKIEAGKLQIEKTACNLHDLFIELGDIFILKMREKNIDFVLDIDPDIPQSLLIDALRLKQVLLNLIGNAVKFTEQGHIIIKAYTANNNEVQSKLDLIIEIEDTGLGISENQQQRIFQKFEQSKGQDNKKYAGTGLGLSISKRLIEMMGGEISLESQVGLGSIFSIHLFDIAVSASTVATEKQNNALSPIINFHPGKILIVDDIKDNRELMLATFADTKLQILTANNGQEAVEMAKKQEFDLILMDIYMPLMNGYQAAFAIKSFSSTPIIALTASVMKDEFDRLKRENFASYLRKPISKADLLNELCKFLPFEETVQLDNAAIDISLTANDKEHLSQALNELEQLSERYTAISQNNNISEIRIFSDLLLEISNDFPVSKIQKYAEQLKTAIDNFDIAVIKQCLNSYPELISQLKLRDGE